MKRPSRKGRHRKGFLDSDRLRLPEKRVDTNGVKSVFIRADGSISGDKENCVTESVVEKCDP